MLSASWSTILLFLMPNQNGIKLGAVVSKNLCLLEVINSNPLSSLRAFRLNSPVIHVAFTKMHQNVELYVLEAIFILLQKAVEFKLYWSQNKRTQVASKG